MSETRNVVFLGASAAGLQAAHYFLKHTLPALKAKRDANYHVYLINPSSEWFMRTASPRAVASTTLLSHDRIFFDIHEGFKAYSPDDFTFIEAAATGLEPFTRTVLYRSSKSSTDERLNYHALVIATGSTSSHRAFSQSGLSSETRDSIKLTNEKARSAKDIVIVGGGPTAIEFAGEVAEYRNGKPGWFSKANPIAKITVITNSDRILPQLRPAIGKTAEQKLKAMGVEIVYNTRVANASENEYGRTTITLAKGDKIEADLYVPAHGVEPNTSWVPSSLLDAKRYIATNNSTLRVDAAGPRVYAFGDVGSYSRNNIWDIIGSLPVLAVNMKRDLLAFDPKYPTSKPKGKDRLFAVDEREGMFVPIGTQNGVGALMGWRVPGFLVWLLKGRDYMIGMSGSPTVGGDSVKKEVKWTKEEAAI